VMNKVVDKSGKVVDKVVDKSGKVVDKVVDKSLSATQYKTLEAIINEPTITYPRLAQAIGVGSTTIQNTVEYLRTHGYIRREGARKNGHWVILKTPN